MNFKLIARIVTVIAVSFTFLPYTDIQSWYIRMMDFPHLQITLITALLLAAYFFIFEVENIFDYTLVGLLCVSLFLQSKKIYPYTSWAPKEVNLSSSNINDSITLYSVNVLQSNKQSDSLLQQIQKYDPDILLFLETDENWKNILRRRIKDHPFVVEYPLDNTYGMILYSKYELMNPEVKLLIEDSIPSIHTIIKLPNDERFKLYAIHPTPPVPMHSPDSHDRDAELMSIALLAKDDTLPVVVMGDFNDVAWSSSTQLFQKVSGLLDIRKGRGIFQTFKADHLIFRWPLDHIFISPHFRLRTFEVGKYMGSDHLPIYINLSLESDKIESQLQSKPSAELIEEAREKIRNEKESDLKNQEGVVKF